MALVKVSTAIRLTRKVSSTGALIAHNGYVYVLMHEAFSSLVIAEMAVTVFMILDILPECPWVKMFLDNDTK